MTYPMPPSPLPGASEKPSVLKWATGLAVFQMVISLPAGLVWGILAFFDPGSEAFKRFQLLRITQSGFQSGGIFAGDLWEYFFYFMFGLQVMAFLAALVTLLAISRRDEGWTKIAWVLLGLHTGVGILGAGNVQFFSLIIFILLLQKKSKAYLGWGAMDEPPTMATPPTPPSPLRPS